MSRSVRLTKSGAGAGAGVGLSKGGLAVRALADEELRSNNALQTVKIMENSIFHNFQPGKREGLSDREIMGKEMSNTNKD